jgi:hypothetical protein
MAAGDMGVTPVIQHKSTFDEDDIRHLLYYLFDLTTQLTWPRYSLFFRIYSSVE